MLGTILRASTLEDLEMIFFWRAEEPDEWLSMTDLLMLLAMLDLSMLLEASPPAPLLLLLDHMEMFCCDMAVST